MPRFWKHQSNPQNTTNAFSKQPHRLRHWHTGTHPILPHSETATLPKTKKNSKAVQQPQDYRQIWHYDIIYGNGRPIGGTHYTLFFVDPKSRKKKLFGLKDIKKSPLECTMKSLFKKSVSTLKINC